MNFRPGILRWHVGGDVEIEEFPHVVATADGGVKAHFVEHVETDDGKRTEPIVELAIELGPSTPWEIDRRDL